MEEKLTKEKIEPLDTVIKRYFIKAFFLCDGNRDELSEKLGIAVRTVGMWSVKFDLPSYYDLKRMKKVDEVDTTQKELELTKKELVENFRERVREVQNTPFEEVRGDRLRSQRDNGYRNVTPEERDDWYNRDRF